MLFMNNKLWDDAMGVGVRTGQPSCCWTPFFHRYSSHHIIIIESFKVRYIPKSVIDVGLIVFMKFRNDPGAILGSIPIFAGYLIEIIPISLDLKEWFTGAGFIFHEDVAFSDFYLE